MKEIVEYAGNESATSLNSSIFLYGDEPTAVDSKTENSILTNTFEHYSGDFNGDGKSDILATHKTYNSTLNTMFHDSYKLEDLMVWESPVPQHTPMYEKSLGQATSINAITDAKQFNFLAADYDGDGRDDVIQVNAEIEQYSNAQNCFPYTVYKRRISNVVINLTKSWNVNTSSTDYLENPVPYPSDGLFNYQYVIETGNFFIPGDFNGDGNQDYILVLGKKRMQTGPCGYPEYYYDYKAFLTSTSTNEINREILNFGIGTNTLGEFYSKTIAEADKINVMDFDGDGKMEVIVTKGTQTYIIAIEGISGTSGFSFAANLIHTTSLITSDSKVYPGDFNGDKKTDLLVRLSNNNNWNILYNTGTSFVSQVFFFNQPINISTHKLAVGDFNGDGKADILQMFNINNGSKICVYYSRGIIGGNADYHYVEYPYGRLATAAPELILGDFNGDGRTDFINQVGGGTGMETDFVSIKAYGKENLLKGVTTGHNVTTTIDYKLLTDKSSYPYFYNRTTSLDDPLNHNPINYVQLPLYVLSKITTSDGLSGQSITDFNYEDAVLHRSGKGFLGFKKVSSSNNVSGITSITENEINTQFAIPYNVKQASKLTATGELLSETIITNSFTDLSTGYADIRYLHKIDKTLSIDYLNGKASETINTYDSYGNVTLNESKVGVLSGNSVTPVETTTTNTAYSIHNTPVPAKPDNVTVTNTRTGMPAVSATTSFTYNANGLPLSETSFSGLPKAVTTTYTYNSFGNPLSVTLSSAGLSNRVNTNVYDAKGRYPIQKQAGTGTNIAQTESYDVDSKWGNTLSIITSDCLTSTNVYDGFGRLIQAILPDGNIVTHTNTWNISGNNLFYSKTHYTGGVPDVKMYYDKFGREYKSEKSSLYIISDEPEILDLHTILTTYDNRGNVKTKTNSYFPFKETARITTTNFDSYNRPISVVNYAGTSTLSYSASIGNSQVTATTAAGQVSTKTMDATGKVVASSDNGGLMNFVYDSRGNQVEAKHGGTTLISSIYDSYGRQVSMQDVNAGTSTYSYDAFGQLESQTDARGSNYNMVYDDLGRIISRTGPEGITAYEYYKNISTGCSNSKPSKITGFNGIVKEYSYDALQRVILTKETIGGIEYNTSYTYNNYSQLYSTTYPSGLMIFNGYDANGYHVKVARNTFMTKIVFSGLTVDGEGRFLTYKLANGITTTQTFDKDFLAGTSTPGIQNLSYNFQYSTGNLLQRSDNLKSQTEVFTYDNLNRLTASTVNGLQQFGMTYDASSGNSKGNIITKTDGGYYQYNSNKLHAVAYTMDSPPAGQSAVSPAPVNVTPHTNQQITYTAYLRPETITENNLTLNFTYGPDYERAETILLNGTSVTETKTYVGDYEKQMKNGTTRELHYINSPIGICAITILENGVWDHNAVYTDYLGSILTVTNVYATVVAEQNFDAWGRYRYPGNWNNYFLPNTSDILPAWLYRGYTGHEMLPEFSLINMNARLYDPILGRMLSPDNFVSTPYGSQGYNRYTYAMNNPLSYVDPDGNDPILVGVIIGAIVGAYSAGTIANGNANPLKWNYGQTWQNILLGTAIGAGSGYLGGIVAASTMPFATTAGIVTGSFFNSVAMNMVTGGQVPVSVGFGAASYNFQSGEVGYLGKKGNSFLENVGYALGAMGNIQDVLLGFNPENVKIEFENLPGEGSKKDLIGHTQIVDMNGNILVDFGPQTGGTASFTRFVRASNSWEQGVELISKDGNRFTRPYIFKVNMARLQRISNRLNNNPGKYNLTFRSCSSVASRALLMSGKYLFGGIYPHTLRLSAILNQAGFRPSLYSYYLNNGYE